MGAIQWQSSTDGVSYANISAATNTTLATGALVAPTYYQAVVISSPCSVATSTVASVTINTNAPSLTSEPVSTNVCAGGTASFSAAATGNGSLSYAWRLRSTGWPSGWMLNAGGGGFFMDTSTDNDNSQPASNGGNDIDTGGQSWGLYNTGGDVTEALRPFPAALGVGQTFSMDMDNGDSVVGTVGFGLQDSSSGSNRLEVYFVGGQTDYTIHDATGEHDSGVPFTWAGINVLVRLTSSNTYAVTIQRYIDGQSASLAGTLLNDGQVDQVRLFDANGAGGNANNLFFNSVRVASADDNAADPAYSGGWTNGSNGGQVPLVNGGDIAGADTSALTVAPAALTDSGSYDVSVSDACGLVTVSSAATLAVVPTPSCSVTPSSAAICAGGSQTFTVNPSSGTLPYTYLWSDGSTGASLTTNAAGTYSVTVTDSNGCTTTCSATLTVNPTPSCSVSPSSAAVCAGGSQTFTVTPSGGTPGYTYLWSDGSTGSTLTTNAAGTYSVTVTDSNGCTTTCDATLTVNPLPTVSVNSATVCAGGSAILTATTGASTPSYLWSPGGATTASITVSPASTTTYTVTVTDGSTGCANSGAGTVTVSPLPTVSVNSATVCAGGSAILTATTGASAPSYLWSPGGATTASITVSPASTTIYTVTVTDGSTGCANSGSGTVTVNPLPATPTAGNNGPICAGSTLNLSTPTVVGATYSWTGPNSFASSQQNPSISNATTAVSGTYLVTITDSNGCTSAAGSTSATVNPNPSTPTASNNGPIIEGNTLNLTASTVDNTTYSWTGPNGFASTNQNPSISNATSAASGAYLVTVTDSNGCTSAAGSTTALVTALQITSITTQGGDILITWLTTGGVTNAVQATPGTPGYNTNFVDISGPLLILGSGDTSTNYVDVGAATNSPAKFYRVRLVP